MTKLAQGGRFYYHKVGVVCLQTQQKIISYIYKVIGAFIWYEMEIPYLMDSVHLTWLPGAQKYVKYFHIIYVLWFSINGDFNRFATYF